MLPNLREENNFITSTKQEANTFDIKNNPKISTIPSPSTAWSKLKDPRIVRVSRALGGKDRHSKVFTVRGLRDRRIRLSVPTAIQLYDLQDRLGLNQPSKAVDWLLNVAKHGIDELPPLQVPPNMKLMSSQSTELDELKVASNVTNWDGSLGTPKANFWNLDTTLRGKSKEIVTGSVEDEDKREDGENASSINLFPRLLNHTSLFTNPNIFNSNFTLPSMGREDLHNFNVMPLPSTTMHPPHFPYHVGTSLGYDPKQVDHFQMLASSSYTSQDPSSNSLSTPTFYSLGQAIRPLHLSMGSNLFGSEDSGGSQSNNNREFPSN